MPSPMTGYIQSVAVGRTVYVGGGDVGWGSESSYIVMAYDIQSLNWHSLPSYKTREFAMAVVKNQLVLVGGHDRSDNDSNMVAMWDASKRQWTHPFPPMPTARYSCSAVAYKQWLVVVGGWACGSMSSVVMLDVDRKQWYSAPRAPQPWCDMMSTLMGEQWYLMGGYDDGGVVVKQVYSVSLSALVSQINSKSSPLTIWKTLPASNCNHSTPLCVGGALLLLGGKTVQESQVVSAIHRYVPETEEWVEEGALPCPLRNFTCTLTSDGKVLLAGGEDNDRVCSSRTYIGSFT